MGGGGGAAVCATGGGRALPLRGKPDTGERRLHRFVANPRLDWRVGAQGVTAWMLRRGHARGPLVVLVDKTRLQAHLKGIGGRLA